MIFIAILFSVALANIGSPCTKTSDCGIDGTCWSCTSGRCVVATVLKRCSDFEARTSGEVCRVNGECLGTNLLCKPCTTAASCGAVYDLIRDPLSGVFLELSPYATLACMTTVCRTTVNGQKCCDIDSVIGLPCNDLNASTSNDVCRGGSICRGGVPGQPFDPTQQFCAGEYTCQVDNDCSVLPLHTTSPCIVKKCINHLCMPGFAAAGTSCGSHLEKCDGNGTCQECSVFGDCTYLGLTECQVPACVANRCVAANAAAGTVCPAGRCDSNGHCSVCYVPTDCGTPASQCDHYVCTSHVCITVHNTRGTTCGATGVCDGNGMCAGCLTINSCTLANSAPLTDPPIYFTNPYSPNGPEWIDNFGASQCQTYDPGFCTVYGCFGGNCVQGYVGNGEHCLCNNQVPGFCNSDGHCIIACYSNDDCGHATATNYMRGCTFYGCNFTNHKCQIMNSPADVPCDLSQPNPGCDGHGNCYECSFDINCPGYSAVIVPGQCSQIGCVNHRCMPKPLPGGTQCMPNLKCDGSGNCNVCSADSDCGVVEVCNPITSICGCTTNGCDPVSGTCKTHSKPYGAACSYLNIFAHVNSICDGSGTCMPCNDDSDCMPFISETDPNCNTHLCKANQCLDGHITPGAPCNVDGTRMCGANGTCLPFGVTGTPCATDVDCNGLSRNLPTCYYDKCGSAGVCVLRVARPIGYLCGSYSRGYTPVCDGYGDCLVGCATEHDCAVAYLRNPCLTTVCYAGYCTTLSQPNGVSCGTNGGVCSSGTCSK